MSLPTVPKTYSCLIMNILIVLDLSSSGGSPPSQSVTSGGFQSASGGWASKPPSCAARRAPDVGPANRLRAICMARMRYTG